jgi:hypothetical protein
MCSLCATFGLIIITNLHVTELRCQVGITFTSHSEGAGFKSGLPVQPDEEHTRARIIDYEMIACNHASQFSLFLIHKSTYHS